MMLEQIRKLLSEGEGLTIEFKECVDELSNSVFETVCSFSNRYGGYIILGVSNDGNVIGIKPSAVQKMKKNFVNTLNNPQRFSPTLFLTMEEITIDGRIILFSYIPMSSQIQSFGGHFYDRNEDGDFDITKSTQLIADLSLRKSAKFTERRVFPYAREDQLKLDELIPIVKRMAENRRTGHPWCKMTAMEIMKSAGLYEDDIVTGAKGFNLAAILLFGRDEVIQQAAPGYVTDCLLRIDNIDRYDDRERVESNLIESFDVVMNFIRKHTLDRFFLIDNLNVSVRDNIAKELVSNILVHREFSSSVPASIVVEKDRLVATNWNRPLQPGRIDPATFKPYPKNPILARFFVQIGYADTLGSGVRNLYKYTNIYSGAEPELIEGDIFKTIIPLRRSVTAGVINSVTDNVTDVTDNVTDVTDNVTDNATDNATDKELSVLKLILENNSYTTSEMAAKLAVSRQTIARSLKALQEKKLIRRVGSDRKGRWEYLPTQEKI